MKRQPVPLKSRNEDQCKSRGRWCNRVVPRQMLGQWWIMHLQLRTPKMVHAQLLLRMLAHFRYLSVPRRSVIHHLSEASITFLIVTLCTTCNMNYLARVTNVRIHGPGSGHRLRAFGSHLGHGSVLAPIRSKARTVPHLTLNTRLIRPEHVLYAG